MPLQRCPDCGGKVSDQAPACPHCGLPNSVAVARSQTPAATAGGRPDDDFPEVDVPSVVHKHLAPGERVLALACCEPILGPTAAYLVVTDSRLLYLRNAGLFSWDLNFDTGPNGILGAKVAEGLLRASITLLLEVKSSPDSEAHPQEFTFPDIPKSEAARLVAAIHQLKTKEYPESMAYRTKRCPDCDELVKARAHRCKHCGHEF